MKHRSKENIICFWPFILLSSFQSLFVYLGTNLVAATVDDVTIRNWRIGQAKSVALTSMMAGVFLATEKFWSTTWHVTSKEKCQLKKELLAILHPAGKAVRNMSKGIKKHNVFKIGTFNVRGFYQRGKTIPARWRHAEIWIQGNVSTRNKNENVNKQRYR